MMIIMMMLPIEETLFCIVTDVSNLHWLKASAPNNYNDDDKER